MRRREFLAALGGASAAWPLTAVSQQPGKVWRVGFVAGGARPVPFEGSSYAGFQIGMRELGYVEGENLAIEWRFAEGRYELFPEFAREFARLKLDAIVSSFSGAVLPMQQANPATPIVMAYSSDPVALGLVSSLARPGGNITGLASALEETVAKQLDLLVAAVPNLSRVAVLLNPANASSEVGVATLESAAKQTGIFLLPLRARTLQEIESVFGSVDAQRAGALIVRVDALFFSYRERIAQLALEHRLPSMFGTREYVQAGGLMSYGESNEEFIRRAASYVNRIFRGAKPADLPVERPTKFYLVINRRTAGALGISIPPLLSMFAEEVIE
jgi:putative ABC transport system substrate-binding protein